MAFRALAVSQSCPVCLLGRLMPYIAWKAPGALDTLPSTADTQ